jgi:hypothetical protein
MFNTFPIEFKRVYGHFQRFKFVFKHFLITNSFCTVDEYLIR